MAAGVVITASISSMPSVRASISIGSVAVGIRLHSLRWRIGFEVLKVHAHVSKQIFAEFFGLLNLSRLRAGDVQVHRLVRLLPRAVLHEAASASLDLDSTTRFLLNVLDISAALSDHLCPEVEAWNILHVDRDSFLGPFPLSMVSRAGRPQLALTYPAKFIALKLFGFSASKSSLVN